MWCLISISVEIYYRKGLCINYLLEYTIEISLEISIVAFRRTTGPIAYELKNPQKIVKTIVIAKLQDVTEINCNSVLPTLYLHV